MVERRQANRIHRLCQRIEGRQRSKREVQRLRSFRRRLQAEPDLDRRCHGRAIEFSARESAPDHARRKAQRHGLRLVARFDAHRYSATANPFLAFRGDEDIYIADLAHDNAIHKVVALEGPDGGSRLLSRRQAACVLHRARARHTSITPTVTSRPSMSKKFSRNRDDSRRRPRPHRKIRRRPTPRRWGPDGIYFEALQKTSAHLFRLDPSTTQITRITSPDSFIGDDASLTKDFKTVAFTAEDGSHMTELYVSRSISSPRANSPTSPRKSATGLSAPRKSSPGRARTAQPIEGVLHKPADYDPRKNTRCWS